MPPFGDMSMRIDKNMTVSEISRRWPKSRTVLLSFGICECCSGNMPLSKIAVIKGLDVDEIISELSKE